MAKPADDTRRGRHEVLITVLLAVAALATAWSSYQAARWHGEQAQATSETNAIRIDAARADTLSDAQRQIDVATFIAWADADYTRDRRLQSFYEERFRPEFATAFAAWQATDPFTSPDAPETPFAMPEYEVEAQRTAESLDAQAEVAASKVRVDIQIAGNYVLSVVLYTVALFFAGMSAQLTGQRPRNTLIVLGYVVLLASVVWVATFPVSIAV
jgi:hypothetical protein